MPDDNAICMLHNNCVETSNRIQNMLLLLLSLVIILSAVVNGGSINVTHNGPVMHGENISFRAALTNFSYGGTSVEWIWEDGVHPPKITTTWNVSESLLTLTYDSQGTYLMNVTANYTRHIASETIGFRILECSNNTECDEYEVCNTDEFKCVCRYKSNKDIGNYDCPKHKICEWTIECSDIPNSTCSPQKYCNCETGDSPRTENSALVKCIRNKNYCTEKAQCTKNAVCSTETKRCVCDYGYVAQDDNSQQLTCKSDIYRPPSWIAPVGISVSAVAVLSCLALMLCLKRHKYLRRSSNDAAWMSDGSAVTISAESTLPPAYDNTHYIHDDPPPPYELVVASRNTTTPAG